MHLQPASADTIQHAQRHVRRPTHRVWMRRMWDYGQWKENTGLHGRRVGWWVLRENEWAFLQLFVVIEMSCAYMSLDNSRLAFIKTDSGWQMLSFQARFQPKQSMQFMRNELWCQNESVLFIFLNCPMRSYGKKGKGNIIQYVNLWVCIYFTPCFFPIKTAPR